MEPEVEPLPRRGDRVPPERPEDLVEALRRYRLAVVLDIEHELISVDPGSELHDAGGSAMNKCIAEEIGR